MFSRIIKTICCVALFAIVNIAEAKTEKFPAPAYTPDQTVSDGKVIYLLSASNKQIFRWSIATAEYLSPWTVGLPQGDNTLAPSKIAVSATHKRLYLGYSSGAIKYINLSGDSAEVAFATTPLAINGLAIAGKYVLAQDYSGVWATHHVFDQAGSKTDSKDWNYFSTDYTWDAKGSRILFLQDSYYPNDLRYEVINQSTGKITSTGDSPYNGTYAIQQPIRLSIDGKNILLGSGNLFKSTGLTFGGSLGGAVTDASWDSTGAVVTLKTSNDVTSLTRLDAALRVVEQQTYSGTAVGVFAAAGNKMAVVAIKNGSVVVYSYTPNDDTDGDGVKNDLDSFPLDVAASVDADKDGYPDKWNAGRTQKNSTTGLVLDAFPKDASCYLKLSGSSKCDYSSTIPNYTPDKVVSDGSTVYLLSKVNKRVYRWSIADAAYVSPLSVGVTQGTDVLGPNTMTLSSDATRLYLGYSTGAIQYLTLKSTAAEKLLTTLSSGITNLSDAGKYLVAQEGNYSGYTSILSATGVVTERRWMYGIGLTWDNLSQRLYYFSGSEFGYLQIDQSTGKTVSSSYLYANSSVGSLSVSPNGQRIMLGNGSIYSKSTMTQLGALGSAIQSSLWLSSNSFVDLVGKNGSTVVQRRNDGLQLLEQLSVAGAPLGVYGGSTQMAVVALKDGTVVIHNYKPSNDTDGDGVENANDAFPSDRAASIDSDRDGYPDAWNQGRNQSDSSTGLTLDAFAQDAACFDVAQGNNGVCNYGLTVPNYTPDQILSDGSTVYLLSAANKRVYRKSVATGNYMNPLVVGINNGEESAPVKMALSTQQNRLYLVYATGAIRYINLNGVNEQPFLSVSFSNDLELLAAGNYVLVKQNSYFKSYDQNANLVDSYYNYGYRNLVWEPTSSKLFAVDSNALYSIVFSNTTGKFGASAAASSNYIDLGGAPVRASLDGQKLLSATGSIYNASDLLWRSALGSTGAPVGSLWLPNSQLVTLVTSDNSTLLQRRNANLQVVEQLSYSGRALGVYGTSAKMLIVVVKDGTVASYSYVPNDDADGDGVSNIQDAFPNDPAAAADTDRDGYPDAWNIGYNQADSLDGLSLDAFPQDAACFANNQGNGGVCDYAAAVPGFIPDQVVSDGSIVYLLSKANKRVYRWSVTAGAYLNPLVVGLTRGTASVAPTSIALSKTSNRLYLGYGSGTIQYIQLGNAAEQLLVSIPAGVEGLVVAGNYLMARSTVNSTTIHSVFSATGSATDRYSTYTPSGDYEWDSVNSRLYFVSNNYSERRLRYEFINQSTGKVGASDGTSYSLSDSVFTPVRVSVNGRYVLLGSGFIYNDQDLSWAASLGNSIADAKWLNDGSLVTLSGADGVTTLQRRSTSLQMVEQLTYSGAPFGVYGTSSKMTVLVIKDGALVVHTYIPNNDTDGDGVVNKNDAFPNDPAASVDSDRDGYPDSWNAGYTQADSTSGLVLDAFAQDAACYSASQSNGGICNYAAAVPDFTPDQIASDSETVYFLSKANKRVYRWSIASHAYINPLVVGINQGATILAPNKIAISSEHGRLYLGYSTGAIQYIELGGTLERPFANIPQSVRGLAAVGNYLLAQDDSGSGATHYTLSASGVVTDSKTWGYYSNEYKWDPESSRVYFLTDDVTPRTLRYETIGQFNGKITGTGAAGVSWDRSISGPFSLSADNKQILVGNGDIYGAADLALVGRSLGFSMVDSVWAGDLIATLEAGGQIRLWDNTNLTLLDSVEFIGTPLELLANGQDLLLIHKIAGAVTVSSIVIGDHDEDGIPAWWENIFGLSDADGSDALLDSDGDGLSNLAEYIHHSYPNNTDTDGDGLTDGNEVNQRGTNPIKADTDGDGLNDYQELITYATSPLLSDSDGDGYTDQEELFFYNSNPNDANSKPQELTVMNQTFEADALSTFWTAGASSKADWYVDSSQAFEGAKSLRSGNIGDSEQSGIVFTNVFAAGTLQFYAKIDAESCCDMLRVYVDGAFVKTISAWQASSWAAFSVPLTSGMHQVEWRYVKDGSVSTVNDSVWIDNVTFVSP